MRGVAKAMSGGDRHLPLAVWAVSSSDAAGPGYKRAQHLALVAYNVGRHSAPGSSSGSTQFLGFVVYSLLLLSCSYAANELLNVLTVLMACRYCYLVFWITHNPSYRLGLVDYLGS